MNRASNFRIGEVILVGLNPTKGHEQHGIRPGLILPWLQQFGLIIIVPLTTVDKGWWTQIRITTRESQLREDSFALCHQIRALSVERVHHTIGQINSLTLGKVKTVLSQVLKL
ncbi:MAG: type II toxin-antitoxin system PemK/MazF family toxin [Candidatus Tectomicrobia bacterium]|uniref:Type II toxin-antitoxin system PemK/MazF family toxin n=1 Tax=Tectimicrobiota bacterium TaxID=2528274 RepID=A0A933GMR1_UNCTE|nr:type II toxin-antitoxin system PemK/MazF family toxin [Candidatus Tectomicrobia bacterium]